MCRRPTRSGMGTSPFTRLWHLLQPEREGHRGGGRVHRGAADNPIAVLSLTTPIAVLSLTTPIAVLSLTTPHRRTIADNPHRRTVADNPHRRTVADNPHRRTVADNPHRLRHSVVADPRHRRSADMYPRAGGGDPGHASVCRRVHPAVALLFRTPIDPCSVLWHIV